MQVLILMVWLPTLLIAIAELIENLATYANANTHDLALYVTNNHGRINENSIHMQRSMITIRLHI